MNKSQAELMATIQRLGLGKDMTNAYRRGVRAMSEADALAMAKEMQRDLVAVKELLARINGDSGGVPPRKGRAVRLADALNKAVAESDDRPDESSRRQVVGA